MQSSSVGERTERQNEFSWCTGDKRRNNRLKLQEERFRFGVENHLAKFDRQFEPEETTHRPWDPPLAQAPARSTHVTWGTCVAYHSSLGAELAPPWEQHTTRSQEQESTQLPGSEGFWSTQSCARLQHLAECSPLANDRAVSSS